MLLTLLKFVGLIIATVSSIWGTMNDVTVRRGGRKVLTRAGKISVGFTLMGLLVSGVSITLGELNKTAAIERQELVEQERTRRIIMSGQQLLSLELIWEFPDVPRELCKRIEEAEEEIFRLPDEAEEQFKYLYSVHRDWAFELMGRYYQLYPWLGVAAGGKWERPSQVLALLRLDESAASVLPFGFVALEPQFHELESDPFAYKTDRVRSIGCGVEFIEDIDAFFTMELPVERERNGRSWAVLTLDKETVIITWSMDPVTLANAVDHAAPQGFTSARLPEEISIVLLTGIADLPMKPENSAVQLWPIPWEGRGTRDTLQVHRSALTLIPNGLREHGVTYELNRWGTSVLEDSGFETKHYYAVATVWKGSQSQ